MNFAKDEILNIKNSKKEINIAKYESNKEFLAPSNYSINKSQISSNFKRYSLNIEPVQEKIIIKNKEKDEKDKENKKDEISSSDISDDDDDEEEDN